MSDCPRPLLATVVHPRGSDVRVSYPVLDFFEVGVVLKGVGDGCRTQRVWTKAGDVDADHVGVLGQDAVDAVRRDRPAGAAGVVADRVEQRGLLLARPWSVSIRPKAYSRCALWSRIGEMISSSAHSSWTANRAPYLVGMEACGGSQHWVRRLQELRHEVKLMSGKMVKAFVCGNKNDAADARAIYMAAQ